MQPRDAQATRQVAVAGEIETTVGVDAIVVVVFHVEVPVATELDESLHVGGVVGPRRVQVELRSNNGDRIGLRVVIGREDEFYSDEDQNALIQYYNTLGYDTHRFEGRHDIHAETLSKILRQM